MADFTNLPDANRKVAVLKEANIKEMFITNIATNYADFSTIPYNLYLFLDDAAIDDDYGLYKNGD